MTTEALLSNYDPGISLLAQEAHELLIKSLPGVQEYPDVAAKLIGFGYGPGYKETICVILLSKKGIKIGFYKGSELNDPKGLLTGSGKVHRYVEIKTVSDLRNPALKKIISVALKAYKERKSKG